MNRGLTCAPSSSASLSAARPPLALDGLEPGMQALLMQAVAASSGPADPVGAPPALQRLTALLDFLGLSGEATVVRALAEAWAAPAFGPVPRQQACAAVGAHLRSLAWDPWPPAPVATALALYPLYRALRAAVGGAWTPPLALWPRGLALPDALPPPGPEAAPPLPWTPEDRHACDDAVLRWVRDGDRQAAMALQQACERAAADTAQPPALQDLWRVAAAWCALLAQGRWPPGALATRMVSRLRSLWQSETPPSAQVAEGLRQELQCLCALVPGPGAGQVQAWPPCLPQTLDAPWPGQAPTPAAWLAWQQALAQAEAAWTFWVDGEGPVAPPLVKVLEALPPALADAVPALAPLAQALQGLGRHGPEGGDPPGPVWGQALAHLLRGLQLLTAWSAGHALACPEGMDPLVAWVHGALVVPEAPWQGTPPPWPPAWAKAQAAERDRQARQALHAAVQQAWTELLSGLEAPEQPPTPLPPTGVPHPASPSAASVLDVPAGLARLRGALPWLGREGAICALDGLAQALHDLAQAAPAHLPRCRERLAEAVARSEASLAGRVLPLGPAQGEDGGPVAPEPSAGAVSPQPPGPPAAIAEAPGEPPWGEVDAPDPELFPLFAAETETLGPRLAVAMRTWLAPADAPGQGAESPDSARREALRVLHTLKGSARMAGAMRLGERAHRLESAIGSAAPVPAHAVATDLLCAMDRLQAHASGLRMPPAAEPSRPVPTAAWGNTPPMAAVRVPADQLDRLLDGAAEVLLEQAQLAGHLAGLREASQALRGGRPSPGPAVQGLGVPQGQDGPTAALAKHLADALAALDRQARQVRQWQQALLQLRLLPFERLAERLRTVVRQAATATGTPATLVLEGGGLALDQGVLERLAPVCEHLLRNAVVHGIEAPALRRAAGKPAEGRLTVSLHPEGPEVVLALHDDGAGVDRARVLARVQALGGAPLPADAPEAAWLDCLFLPGFSTAEAVSDLAGRGMGLDAVQAEIQALGGRIDVATEPGRGTTFRIRVPLTAAVTPVVLVRVGPRVLGVPAPRIEQVLRLPLPLLAQARREARLRVEGEAQPWPFACAADVLGAPPEECPEASPLSLPWQPVLLCRSGTHRLAWQVDAVLGRQALVTRPLAPPLDQVPGLVGASVRASGAPVLLYDPVVLGATPPPSGASPGDAWPESADPAPLVLVVDDAPTVRAHLQRWLQAEGYRVAWAEDGHAALAALRAQRPAVVLSDLDMPRLDGLGLARALQADADLRAVPLLVLTARVDDATLAQARSLGVRHCLVKPFDPAELRDWLRRCARMGAAMR